ncbi:hypothetical protein UA08_08641 [Talaromyces atroroseus]|uniref:RNase III domain-containing protein n=1 Tax=Talaromyces atroroseus TaxID=1441469 RepID=A0A225AK83_TALAT|nr:hypothetical protein UA08_08641 [Talaromyces atroroseus]OKL55939.1 hypothetical protein UA08_08641 [Talaromyces atroroseus]
MEAKCTACQGIIDYTFSNPTNILTALNMAGGNVFYHNSWVTLDKNTRLAVYGDSAAHAYLCGQWVRTKLDKASWNHIRSDVMSNDSLARVGFSSGLDRCINLNPGTLKVSSGMMATTVGAILGAVHLDGGDAALAMVMDNLGLTHDLLVMSFLSPLRIYSLCF